ncbi:hypothetical protein [Sneathiella sp.]|uniref:hypothetical protein n=1 Tax=Sneathiella sp. TaxID=1964365 RepID=UPI002FE13389
MADVRTSHDRMSAAWGDSAPDWVLAMAKRCDELKSQRKVADMIGYSTTAVSMVLAKNYAGDIAAIEEAVRGALMKKTVQCPVLGDLPSNECLAHQKRPFSTANRLRIRLYEACRSGCPHSRLIQKETNDAV